MQFQEMAVNLGLDIHEFNELVTLFLETARNDIHRIKTALENADAGKIAAAAHSIKGSAGNLGFALIAAEAQKLEDHARKSQLTGMMDGIQILTEKLNAVEKKLSDLHPR